MGIITKKLPPIFDREFIFFMKKSLKKTDELIDRQIDKLANIRYIYEKCGVNMKKEKTLHLRKYLHKENFTPYISMCLYKTASNHKLKAS